MQKRQRRWQAAAGSMVCLLLIVTAMLIWGRLRLVTGVPRTALAEPESSQVDRNDQASENDQDATSLQP